MRYSPLREIKNQKEDKSQKTAVIVTGTYPEVRKLLKSYKNAGYTSDKIMSLVFVRGDVALKVMDHVLAENKKRVDWSPKDKLNPHRITL